jgi:hypothetical protein
MSYRLGVDVGGTFTDFYALQVGLLFAPQRDLVVRLESPRCARQ